ncbi:hypothetical protein [Acidovorax sp. CCYZU-2555]|uniref:hypothetical protein n=1 Tax=Acidovorax sp. CCYZU-2555 TaxID=2835042 RepID=UPI001BD0D85E|nr:hypothetical protein [Acidovorax sp. CCYZU-2555]MBS7777831.1 hypothetical protein [Acidovorax sp. CCYZU-2555]
MTVNTALFELHALQQALQQLSAGKITASELGAQARATSHLLARLPPRYGQVLQDLLDRLEASALFTEESCSFSQSELLTHLQGWADKAQETLELTPQVPE